MEVEGNPTVVLRGLPILLTSNFSLRCWRTSLARCWVKHWNQFMKSSTNHDPLRNSPNLARGRYLWRNPRVRMMKSTWGIHGWSGTISGKAMILSRELNSKFHLFKAKLILKLTYSGKSRLRWSLIVTNTPRTKSKVCHYEIMDYAMIWWGQLRASQRRNREHPIETWDELRSLMKKKFVSNYYHWDLHQRLQALTQGNKSVKDYNREMEMLMIRADIHEDVETIMTCFLNGLKPEISKIVELQQYLEMSEIVDKSIKVEQRLKRRGNTRFSSTTPFSNWRTKPLFEEGEKSLNSTPQAKSWIDQPKASSKIEANKGGCTPSIEDSKTQNRYTKRFKCQGYGHIQS